MKIFFMFQVFAAVEAMSDRVCIHSSQSKHFHFSAENLLTCCHSCGNGCHGGSHKLAWNYWVEHGIVSGGSFDSKQVSAHGNDFWRAVA